MSKAIEHAGVLAVLKAIDAIDLPEGIRVSIELDEPAKADQPGETAKPVGKARTVSLVKAEQPAGEERYILGIVLEPLKELGKKDSQDDTYSAEEVRKACHLYMEDYRNIGKQHTEIINGDVTILENWIARADFVENGQQIYKGTWLQGLRINKAEIWSDIKEGKITGLSIGGWADSTRLQ